MEVALARELLPELRALGKLSRVVRLNLALS